MAKTSKSIIDATSKLMSQLFSAQGFSLESVLDDVYSKNLSFSKRHLKGPRLSDLMPTSKLTEQLKNIPTQDFEQEIFKIAEQPQQPSVFKLKPNFP